MNKHPFVSIIIPVFNSGERIKRCLDTLINQTLSNIEIICILDKPTDGCDIIVEQYASKDDRIVILRHSQNMHVSQSRNDGISVAKGDYIGFSDDDDYRELNMYELLYNEAIQSKADIVSSDVYHIYEGGAAEIRTTNVRDKYEALSGLILPFDPKNEKRIIKSCWHSLYRRELIENIRFLDRRRYYEEDTLFNIQAYLNARTISHVSTPLYTWDHHSGSLCNQDPPQMAHNVLNYIEEIMKLLRSNNLDNRYCKQLYYLIEYCMKKWYKSFWKLNKTDKIKWRCLLKEIEFPIFQHPNLALVSRTRLKLDLLHTYLLLI